MKKLVFFVFAGLFFITCTRDEALNPLDLQLKSMLQRRSPDGSEQHFRLPDSDDLSSIPAGRSNPLTREKIALGKMLFFETGIALDSKHSTGRGTYSCGTCHVPASGFMPGRMQGVADGGTGFGRKGESRTTFNNYRPEELDVQGARPLSVLNVAYVTNSTWSGKFGGYYANVGTEDVWNDDPNTAEVNHLGLDGLEAQNIEGLKIHRMVVNKAVVDSLGYTKMFDAAFPDFPEESRYGLEAASFALSAYIRSLITNQAPFQRWLRGESEAMSDAEKRGAILFYSKAGCYRCHKGPALSATEFHALGVKDLYEAGGVATGPADRRNLGRGGFTHRVEDMYKFKIPQIYNMGDANFFFHGSSKQTLEEVVDYFNLAIPENPNVPKEQISPFFHPLNLTEQEKQDLVAFLRDGLRDPDLNRYVPIEVLSGNCFPNNDPLSKGDLGCK